MIDYKSEKMIVITSGKRYLDIDAYATCIAYRELLKMLGIEAKFVSTAPLNYSITKSLLEIPYTLDNYNVDKNDKFIVIDISNKEFFEDFVKKDNVIEIIDHHPGFDNYWNNLLGKNSIIEQIGSVATIIVEKYEENNLLNKMDKNIAKLLMAAILDNTLNFTAEVTKKRDKDAYNKLEQIAENFTFKTSYFSECQKIVEDDLINSIVNDVKIEETSKYLPKVLGQLTIWNITTILDKKDIIKEVMNSYGNEWLINIISLEEKRSYVVCSNENVKNNISKLFNCTTASDVLIISPAKLRKEIIKIALDVLKS